MNKNNPFVRFFSLILVASLLLASCGAIPMNEGGAMQTETHSVDMDAANSVKVQVVMDLGVLNISSSTAKLMEGTFQYNVSEWKPKVVYELSGNQGTLSVTQPDKTSGLVKNGENTWNLQLGEAIPMVLNVKVGAGESALDLTHLTADTGLGSLVLDLRGQWTHDINVDIHSGIGEVTIRLPAETGTRVEVKNGIGSVNEKGMEKNGKAYVNGSFGKTPYTLYIQIDNGTGKVNLEG